MNCQLAELFTRTGVTLLLLIVVGLAALWWFFPMTWDTEIHGGRIFAAPSLEHPMGCDNLGRDLYSCLVSGLAASLGIALTAVGLSAFLGTLAGAAAGLAGGFLEYGVMRLADMIAPFPGLLAAIIFASFFSGGAEALVLFFTLSGWPSFARIMRGEVIKYKGREFILAARACNASMGWLIFRHLAPLAAPLILSQALSDLAGVLIAQTGLEYFGLGTGPDTPSIGGLLEAGIDYMFYSPRLALVSGGSLTLLLIAFQFLGEGFNRKYSQ